MKKIIYFFLFSGMFLLINACSDGILEEDDSLLKSNAGEKELIEKVRNWFVAHPQENDFGLMAMADHLHWNKALVHDADTALFVEVPLKLSDNYVVEVKGDKEVNVEQRLLFKCQENTIAAYQEYLVSTESKDDLRKITKFNFMSCQTNARVNLLAFDKAGKLAYRKHFAVSSEETSVEMQVKKATYRCLGMFVIYSDGTRDLLYLIYCYGTGSDDMNGQKPGSGGAGGNGGGQAPSAADCKCSVCSVCGGCTDLEILKSFKDNGEDGGAMINCPVCSCPVVDVTGFEDNDKAKCIYQKLISGRILSDFIDRYFAPTEQNHSLLGELNLTWTTGNCAGDAIAETIPISIPDNNSYYSVEIRMDEEKLAQNSSSIIALTMLHEALHAKLMAEYYDEVGSTDYKALYAYYNGWGLGGIDKNQEYEMMNLYANEMAQALKDFDKTQGINYPLDFYKEVLKYDFSNQLGLDRYETGNDEYHLFYSSSKNCK